MKKMLHTIYICIVLIYCTSSAAADRVLILKSGNIPIINETADALKSEWHKGSDIVTIKSSSETINTDDYAAAVAIGSKASTVLKSNHRKGFPAVYSLVLSPSEIDLFTSGFVGISPSPDFNSMLSDLNQRIGAIKTVGVIYSGNSEYLLEPLEGAAAKMNISVEAKRVSGKYEIAGALNEFKKIDLFYLMPDPLLCNETSMVQIFSFFNKTYTPTVGTYKIALMFGASYAYTVEYSEVGKTLAKEVSLMLENTNYRPKMIYLNGRLYTK